MKPEYIVLLLGFIKRGKRTELLGKEGLDFRNYIFIALRSVLGFYWRSAYIECLHLAV